MKLSSCGRRALTVSGSFSFHFPMMSANCRNVSDGGVSFFGAPVSSGGSSTPAIRIADDCEKATNCAATIRVQMVGAIVLAMRLLKPDRIGLSLGVGCEEKPELERNGC